MFCIRLFLISSISAFCYVYAEENVQFESALDAVVGIAAEAAEMAVTPPEEQSTLTFSDSITPSSMEENVVSLDSEASELASIAEKINAEYDAAKQEVDSARENYDKINEEFQKAGEDLEKAERAFKQAQQMKLLADAATK